MVSSLAAARGAAGMAHYAAACAHLDAYAAAANRQAGRRWLSIGFAGWDSAQDEVAYLAALDRLVAHDIVGHAVVERASARDRPAVRPAAPASAPADNAVDEPTNSIEARLVALWQELLGVSRAGRNSDFFALGGDSLIALQLIGRIKERFGAALTIRDVFENPTVARLAQRVGAGADADAREEFEL